MTVRAKTSGENTKTRGGGQYSEVFVIPRIPNVIYTARLDTLPSSTDLVYQIAVTGGSGDASDILPDMKMLVGTSAGGDDLGFCRVRATPTLPGGAGNVKIGELSHIDWQASCYLTIVDDYDIMPRHLKITAGVPYIDYETAYSNQYEDFDPIVNMGGHRVLLLDGGSVSHQRDASASEVFDGTISSWLWEAPDASSIADETTDSPTITYDTAGHFVEYLTVTSNDGKTWRGVRYIFIVDPATLSSNIHSLEISETDGTSMMFTMTDGATLADFKHRAFVIAWTKDYYNGTQENISYQTGEENILFSGRIASERMEFDDELGVIQFVAQDWKYWLKKISAFPFGLERKNTTTGAWTSMTGLNVDRAVWALLHHYSTATRICDFHLSGDTRYAEELRSSASNIAAQLSEIAATSIFADLVFDRYGAGWLRVEPQLVPEADRSSWAVIQTITSQDYQERLSVELNTYEETSQVASSGVSVSQYGSGNPHFSLSYGRIFAVFGDPANQDTLLLADQDQSNTMAGLFMGWANRLFDGLSVPFVGNNRMFSVAEYCRAYISIAAGDNPRGKAYTGYLIPRAIGTRWDKESGLLQVTVEFQDESQEQIAVTGDFPEDTGIDDIDFSFPPMPNIPIPPFMPITIPAGMENENQPKKVAIATSLGVFYTTTFDTATPIWIAMNSGLTDDQRTNIAQMVHTIEGKLYMLTKWDWLRGYLYCMGVGSLGGTWVQIAHADAYPVDPTMAGLWGLAADPSTDLVGVHAGRGYSWATDGHIGEHRLGFGSVTNTFAWSGKLADYGHRTSSGIVLSGDQWFIFGSGGTGFLGSANTPQLFIASYGGVFSAYYTGLSYATGPATKGICTMGFQKKVMFWDDGGVAGYNTSDGGTPVGSTGINPNPVYAVSFASDGLVGLGASGTTAYKTTDGGASWSSIGGVIPIGFTVWENCKDVNRWIFAGGTEIRLTMDAGATYENKNGNLSLIAPLVSIKAVRFIE